MYLLCAGWGGEEEEGWRSWGAQEASRRRSKPEEREGGESCVFMRVFLCACVLICVYMSRQKQEKVLGCLAFALYTQIQEGLACIFQVKDQYESLIWNKNYFFVLWNCFMAQSSIVVVCIVCVYVYVYVYIYTHTLIGLLCASAGRGGASEEEKGTRGQAEGRRRECPPEEAAGADMLVYVCVRVYVCMKRMNARGNSRCGCGCMYVCVYMCVWRGSTPEEMKGNDSCMNVCVLLWMHVWKGARKKRTWRAVGVNLHVLMYVCTCECVCVYQKESRHKKDKVLGCLLLVPCTQTRELLAYTTRK